MATIPNQNALLSALLCIWRLCAVFCQECVPFRSWIWILPVDCPVPFLNAWVTIWSLWAMKMSQVHRRLFMLPTPHRAPSLHAGSRPRTVAERNIGLRVSETLPHRPRFNGQFRTHNSVLYYNTKSSLNPCCRPTVNSWIPENKQMFKVADIW